MKTEYELMVILHAPESVCEGSIDSAPLMVGDALSVIRRLLRDDSSVSNYKIVNKGSKR